MNGDPFDPHDVPVVQGSQGSRMRSGFAKVICISYNPFTERIGQIFYLGHFARNGIRVEYWDIQKICCPDVELPADEIPETIARVRRITSLRQLNALVAAEDKAAALFCPLISYEFRVLDVFRILSRYRCRTGFFARGFIPYEASSIGTNLRKAINPRSFLEFLQAKFAAMLRTLRIVRPYEVAFCAGRKAIELYPTAKAVNINFYDYDDFLREKSNPDRIIPYRYAVFLDTHLIGDIDLKMLGVQDIDAQNYYAANRRFFDLLERKFDLKVIIAAHPRSDYRNQEFGDRPVFKHLTNQLTKSCEFVITHYSSAVSFAVCYQKPVCITYSEAMKSQFYFAFILGLAHSLGVEPSNMDRISDVDGIRPLVVDREKFRNHMFTFLSSRESENRLSEDIIVEYLHGGKG